MCRVMVLGSRLVLATVAAMVVSQALGADPVVRTWTDQAGRFTTVAAFVDFSDGKVRLKKQTGQIVSVPLERLSKTDQEFVKRQLARPAAQTRAAGKIITVKAGSDFNVTTNDMQRIGDLVGGVGRGFEPREEMDEALRTIGIKRIRCINVCPVGGKFDEKDQYQFDPNDRYYDRLRNHFRTCRAVGASPHIIISPGAGRRGGDDSLPPGVVSAGGVDWRRYRTYLKAFFKHVLVDSKFPNAAFEVGNEPDIAEPIEGGEKGSRRNYEHYFQVYREVANAARQYEAENPGQHVHIGGPALSMAFTFQFGAFNWAEKFLQDVGREKLKIDFFSGHFYGNMSPLSGAPTPGYPTYSRMLQMLRHWRDQHVPGLPIYNTEWGASYHTSMDAPGIVNGNHVGAAFAPAMINQMLVDGVDRAFFLVTTDAREQRDGQWYGNWGWPSLFVNPKMHGIHPKATYNVLKMFSMMGPRRVEAATRRGAVNCIASRDDDGRLTVLVWHYHRKVRKSESGKKPAHTLAATVRVQDAADVWKGPVRFRRWLVGPTVSNAYHLFQTGQALDERCELQQVDEGVLRVTGGVLDVSLAMPPLSVSLIELRAME